jgi:hypothetical protein
MKQKAIASVAELARREFGGQLIEKVQIAGLCSDHLARLAPRTEISGLVPSGNNVN